jgi:tRNA threonylcarbamoyl adenosine modification protein YeaZ
MICLAFDTALDACSAAVWADGRVLAEDSVAAARGHAELLFPLLARLLDDAGVGYPEIDRIGVTIGPGSFTGVRVGVAAARGLALALGRPAVGVSTLEALAATAAARGPILADSHDSRLAAAIDARRGEIYLQVFAILPNSSSLIPVTSPEALTPKDAAGRLPEDAVALVGTGAALVGAAAARRDLRVVEPAGPIDPGVLAGIAAAREIETGAPPPSPLYLRAPDAKLPAETRHDRARG